MLTEHGRMSGGKSNTRGTPQGGVASPLLANIYMNRFLKYWRLTKRGEAFSAHVVCYADDFVILSCGRAAQALTWTKAVMTKLGLTLNQAKTSLRNARQDRFDFLGYSFGPHHYKANGKRYLGAAREAGLLTSEALKRLLRDAIRRRQAAHALRAISERMAEAGIEPMSMEEIGREVKAVRAERRRRAGGR